ncbi:MAG: hypothetical protein JNJ77_14470 [Planctomycetia bacterium]|nr:hypothetical protein [Planctomycetia bacterium]
MAHRFIWNTCWMKDSLLPPKPEIRDTIHTLLRALISTIPIVGGPAVEIFNAILTPPIERRKNEWMCNVAQDLAQLQQNDDSLVDRIIADEKFVSVLLHATHVAIRNHQAEKLLALKTVVLNTAKGIDLNADLELLFIRYVDELSPSHLKVLEFLCSTERKVAHLIKYQQLYDEFKKKTNIDLSTDFFKLACDDLKARSLVRVSSDLEDFPGLYVIQPLTAVSSNAKPTIIVTEIGHKFIDFVLNDQIQQVSTSR